MAPAAGHGAAWYPTERANLAMAQNLFEDQQEQLERNVERLSKVLATDVLALPGGDGFGRGAAARPQAV